MREKDKSFTIKPCPMCDKTGYVIRTEGGWIWECICPKCQGKRFYIELVGEE